MTSTKTYDAFGMLQASTGSSASPFGFAGKHGYQEDGDSGLKLLGHRYYDASTGRFLTRDPVKDGRNWYSYCENNPLKSVDPTGYTDYEGTIFAGGMINRSKTPIRVLFDMGSGSDRRTYWMDVPPGYKTNNKVDVDWVRVDFHGWIHVRGGTNALALDQEGYPYILFFAPEKPETGAYPNGWDDSNPGKSPPLKFKDTKKLLKKL